MSDLLSEQTLTKMTEYILNQMKLSPECHIIDGHLNPYDFLNNAIAKSETYWLTTIKQSVSDKDIASIHLLPLMNQESATLGIKIMAIVAKYTEGALSYSQRDLQTYTFPDDTLTNAYRSIANLVQYYVKNKTWLEAEIGSATENIPIFHADRFTVLDKDGVAVPIESQVDVVGYHEEQQAQEEAKYKYGNPITVLRSTTSTIEGGTDTFYHNDFIEFKTSDGPFTATVIAIPGDGTALFVTDSLLTFKSAMNEKGGIAGGYEASSLRNSLANFYDYKMPDDIKKKCVPFENGDYLSIPTAEQMFGKNSEEVPVSGQIEYFKNRRNRISTFKSNLLTDGEWYPYWTQTTGMNNTYVICDQYGDFSYYSPSSSNVGIRILFKLSLQSNKKIV